MSQTDYVFEYLKFDSKNLDNFLRFWVKFEIFWVFHKRLIIWVLLLVRKTIQKNVWVNLTRQLRRRVKILFLTKLDESKVTRLIICWVCSANDICRDQLYSSHWVKHFCFRANLIYRSEEEKNNREGEQERKDPQLDRISIIFSLSLDQWRTHISRPGVNL